MKIYEFYKNIWGFIVSILASLIAGIILGNFQANSEYEENILITGYAKSMDNKKPLENVLVEVISYPNSQALTDSKGYFALVVSNIDEKILTLLFTSQNNETDRRSVKIDSRKNIIKLTEDFFKFAH